MKGKDIGVVIIVGILCFGMYAIGHNHAEKKYAEIYKAGANYAKSICIETIREEMKK